jgi:hypothetical protein
LIFYDKKFVVLKGNEIERLQIAATILKNNFGID